MNNNHIKITKSNKLIEAQYRLSVQETKAILACIAQVNPLEIIDPMKPYYLYATDLMDLFGVDQTNAYKALKDIASRLFHRYVTIDTPDPNHPEIEQTQTRWISAIDYVPTRGQVRLYFAPKIIPYLTQLEGQFTSYKLECIAKMNSSYGIRLYELLVQWQCSGFREVEIEWLKKQFQLENKYSRFYNFKVKVIEPAIKDINKHSNLWVKWGQRKQGRNISHLQFEFGLKEETKKITSKIPLKKLYKTPQSITNKDLEGKFSKYCPLGANFHDARKAIFEKIQRGDITD
jgi:plasmid replication initiation protein